MSTHSPTLSRASVLLALALSCGVSVAQQRVPWTTSRIHGTPEPPPPYVTERIFPALTFSKPLDIQQFPGSDRLMVLEENGRLLSVVPGAEKADDFGNLPAFDPEIARVYALTFHPRFAENRFAYTFSVLDLKGREARENGSQIIRFRVTDENPPRLDTASAKVLLTWRAGGHNGGNLRFGPDGMLYISTGDAMKPDPPDGLVTGQDISDLLSSVLRIDVDHPDAGRAYGIPKDNPFLTEPGARGEVWAYGLRNPWRMSFDPKSGELFAGDVGWELWEMIYRIRRGRNYGWSITDPSRSTLLYRMATGGRGHMPYLGAKLVDDRGVLVLREWIAGMKPNKRDISEATASQRKAEELSLTKFKAGDAAQLDRLLATGSSALSVLLAVVDGSLKGDLRTQAIEKSSALADPLRRDLFERFLPESQRRKVLGAEINPNALLAQKGDATRGRIVFAGVCVACHRVGDAGTDFGPDLSRIGTKWNRAAMLEQILTPSKLIEPQWLLATVTLKDGAAKTGFIASRTDGETALKLPGGIVEKIPAAQIGTTSTTRVSLMPEGMLQNLTAQEAADLLEFLATLK